LLRIPTPQERALAMQFIETHALDELCRAVMNTNEFVFMD